MKPKAKRKPQRRNPPRRQSPPSPAELVALAAAAPAPEIGVAILTAAWSGLRETEVSRLQGRDIVEGDRYAMIRVRNGKGNKDRLAILLPDGLAALRTLPEPDSRGPECPLFLRSKGRIIGAQHDRRSIYKDFVTARTACGLPQYVFHDLRRFYASHLLNSGVSDIDVAAALGHIDRNGQPDPGLVRKVYGFVNIEQALARAAEGAINAHSAGEVPAAAYGGFGASERHQVAPRGSQAPDQAWRGGPGTYRFRARGPVVGDDAGLGGSGGGAEAGQGEGKPHVDAVFRRSLKDARRALREAAAGDYRALEGLKI